MTDQRWHYTPAADHDLPPLERFRSVRREPGLLSWALHHASAKTIRTYFQLVHGFRVEGAEHLPTSPPFVVVANHASHLDALVLASALPPGARGCAYPIAAGDVFFETMASSVLTSIFINALPLWRKRVTRHALDELRARIQTGDCGFILFPEGARSRDGSTLPFKPGIGRLIAATRIPVVPCWIDGAFEALPPHASIPRPKRIRVTVGRSMTFQEVANERHGWDRVAASIEESVLTLGGRPRPSRGESSAAASVTTEPGPPSPPDASA